MISPEFSTAVTLLLYGSASVAGLAGIVARTLLWRRIGCTLAVVGFACQTFMLVMGFHKVLPGGLSAGAYFQLMAWFVVLCGIAAWAKLRQEIPLVFATPLGLMLFAMSAPYLASVVQVPASLNTSFYALHIGTLFLSLALLALALCLTGDLLSWDQNGYASITYTVEQIGGTAVFLCSEAAAQITGTTISVDGGWTAL